MLNNIVWSVGQSNRLNYEQCYLSSILGVIAHSFELQIIEINYVSKSLFILT